MIKAVIFDWDGVIADTPMLVYKINLSIGRKFNGKTFSSYDDFRKRIHEWRDIYQNIDPSNRNIVDKAQDMFRSEMKKSAGKIRLYEGMQKVIVEMSQNYSLGIASHSPREAIYFVLRKNKIEKCFKSVVGCNEAKKLKPHPEHLRVCMKAMGSQPNETCKIGDAIYDIEAARAAKLAKVIAVSWGICPVSSLRSADVIIDRPEEIPNAIRAG